MVTKKNPFLLGKVKKISGSASRPHVSDRRLVLVLVGTSGEFEEIEGNAEISKTWPKAKELYRSWWRGQNGFKYGVKQEVKLAQHNSVQVLSDTEVMLLLVCDENGINEKALELALNEAGKYAAQNKNNVHINNQSRYDSFEQLLTDHVAAKGSDVYIYE